MPGKTQVLAASPQQLDKQMWVGEELEGREIPEEMRCVDGLRHARKKDSPKQSDRLATNLRQKNRIFEASASGHKQTHFKSGLHAALSQDKRFLISP
jgi:hypothetical protein